MRDVTLERVAVLNPEAVQDAGSVRDGAEGKAPLNGHTLRWSAATQAVVSNVTRGHEFPLIAATDVCCFDPTLDYWDAWPLLCEDGNSYQSSCGTEYWFALSAHRFDDPDERHGQARIYLLERTASGFRSLGPALPTGFGDGSREWSGSATIHPATKAVTLFFTASGRRGEASISFEQRIFRARCFLADDQLVGWQRAVEIIAADGVYYAPAIQSEPQDGRINGFRDPAIFRDPADGREWLSFTATSAADSGPFNGVIGLAAIENDGTATLCPPLVNASGYNHELELPHIRHFDGRYYLFWSTQSHMFVAGEAMPTGLYGAVADSVTGPWRPLNGSGLVAANPAAEPLQCYAWIVLPDRKVTSFINQWGLAGRSVEDMTPRRAQFGGTFAPFVSLLIEGDHARLA